MGFGTLFFGYFVMFAFSLSKAYFFADIIGAAITLYAFSRLAQYNRYFVRSMAACVVFMGFCAVNATSLMFQLYDPAGTVDFVVDLLKEASACVMHIFLFLGMRGISLGASAQKLVEKAERNLVVTMVYYAASVLILLFHRFLGDIAPYVSTLLYLYWIVCLILNLSLIYHCFGILCPADEDESEPKRSRFALINKISDKFDEIERDKEAYRRESMQKALDEAERVAQEKEKKHPHKKKKH